MVAVMTPATFVELHRKADLDARANLNRLARQDNVVLGPFMVSVTRENVNGWTRTYNIDIMNEVKTAIIEWWGFKDPNIENVPF